MARHATFAPHQTYKRHQRKRLPTKFEIFMYSLKATSKAYCRESSIGGLKHLVDQNIPCIERIIWIIVLIGALVGSVILVWVTFQEFFLAPLVTTQFPEGIPITKIVFPAVGICTNNRISRRAVTELTKKLLQEERNKKYNETEMMALLFGLGQLYDFQMVDSNEYSPLEIHTALGQYDVNELLRNLTPRCEDLLVRCEWNEDVRNCTQLFDFRLTMNGYCCSFNYLRHSDVLFTENKITFNGRHDMHRQGNKSSYDVDQGLKVLLRLNDSDDFYYNLPLQGAQVQFSDAYDFPDSPSGSFSMQMISPKVEMTVLVHATYTEASRDVQGVSLDLRQCLFHDESPYLAFYTHSDCLVKCRMMFLLKKCNCTPFNMPKMINTRTCDLGDLSCLRRYYMQSISLSPRNDLEYPPDIELYLVAGGIKCPMCYPTCSKTAYKYNFFNVNIYPDVLNAVPDADRDDWLQAVNYTGTSILHVKYGSDAADYFRQNVIMKWFDLISNIGSTWGFVTGFSFVSVLEFIYFFTVKLIREIRNRRGNKLMDSLDNMSNQLDNFEGYIDIYWNELGMSKNNIVSKKGKIIS